MSQIISGVGIMAALTNLTDTAPFSNHREAAKEVWPDNEPVEAPLVQLWPDAGQMDGCISCGAASLATLLNEYYGQSVTEEQLLAAMYTGDLMASFEDMRRALEKFGFRSVGFSASYDQLAKINMPGVVYLEHRKTEHFSVLRGINEDTVWLADPSLGNRTYSRWQFLDMWNTQGGKSKLEGRVLGVLPLGATPSPSDFFTKTPKRQTALAVQRIRAQPERIAPSLHRGGLWP